jgi:hypothetical protein
MSACTPIEAAGPTSSATRRVGDFRERQTVRESKIAIACSTGAVSENSIALYVIKRRPQRQAAALLIPVCRRQ